MSDVELRPCPFCGNKDIETKSSPWLVDDFIVWASCSQCGASVEKENGDMDGVIAAWNRRATDEHEEYDE